MSKLLYFLATFGQSALSVFGIRGSYEQPPYVVLSTLAPGIEIRAYPARQAVQTAIVPAGDTGDAAAFGRLFRYITGANADGRLVAMTVPVEQAAPRRATTLPVERSGDTAVMRFFLPAKVAAAGAPVPADKDVQVVSLPAATFGVARYSGVAGPLARARQTSRLRQALAKAGATTQGAPLAFSYDPPFTVPILRRNEIALQLKP